MLKKAKKINEQETGEEYDFEFAFPTEDPAYDFEEEDFDDDADDADDADSPIWTVKGRFICMVSISVDVSYDIDERIKEAIEKWVKEQDEINNPDDDPNYESPGIDYNVPGGGGYEQEEYFQGSFSIDIRAESQAHAKFRVKKILDQLGDDLGGNEITEVFPA